jgi:hypothetical protein
MLPPCLLQSKKRNMQDKERPDGAQLRCRITLTGRQGSFSRSVLFTSSLKATAPPGRGVHTSQRLTRQTAARQVSSATP